jgi:protein ImuB
VTNLFSAKRRYLALWLPLLPTDRLHRQKEWRQKESGAAPDDRPLAVLCRQKNALRIAHADRHACALGIRPGMTFADARTLVPEIVFVEEDHVADIALRDAIAEWCDRYSPLVGVDDEAGLMLDIAGCTHLFGGEDALRADITSRLMKMGFSIRSAIAGTPDAARAVARFSNGGVVPPGGEAAAVRPLPVAALGVETAIQVALARAGLKTIADLADRPRAPLAARFGADLVDRIARTLGEIEHPISPRRPIPELIVERRFAAPIAHADDVLGTIRRLAVKLVPLLETRGAGGRHFEASIFRTDGAVRRIAVASGRPLRDAAVLMKLFAERIDALADPIDPGFGFDMIRLAVLASEDLLQAQTQFDGREQDDEAVAELIDRLSARFGAAQVMRFVAHDSHIPERMARAVVAQSAQASRGAWPARVAGEPPAYPLRLFDPPQPIETMAEVPDSPPVRFLWRRVWHNIVASEGPQRIAPEWWARGTAERTRDYFRVEDREGRRYWLYREGLYDSDQGPPHWFLHGLFA